LGLFTNGSWNLSGMIEMNNFIKKTDFTILIFITVLMMTASLFAQKKKAVADKFPNTRPKNGNFNRPVQDEICDVSPPGFCWWRVGERGKVFFRLIVSDAQGNEVYRSSLLDEPAHIPDIILPAGKYSWIVEAIESGANVIDIRPSTNFIISEDAIPFPWIDPEILLKKIPKTHPRLLFPGNNLVDIHERIFKIQKDDVVRLKSEADKVLNKPLVNKPDFDKYTSKKEYATKRTAYRKAYHEVGDTYLGGVIPLALTYLLTQEEKYGQAAKKHVLQLLDWGSEGVMSVQSPRFDEVGLKLARSLPMSYDWCYDLFSDEERVKVESMLVQLGNKLLERMKKRDFLNTSGESHDGRIPGYLLEFAIALAEYPDAKAWMEYGLKAILTVFPHWAGSDGGWAEGFNYSLTYNDRFITPPQSFYISTGLNLWQKSFFRKFPNFLIYAASPLAETTPFGDQEHRAIYGSAEKISWMLRF